MTIIDRLDLDQYLAKFSSFFAREKDFILQGDINTHYKFISELQKHEFAPPPTTKNLDKALAHLQKQGVLSLEDIFEFIKMLRYFDYLKGLEFDHSVQKWLDDIVFVDEVYACSEFFDKKGEFEISKDSLLYGLHEALKRNKEEVKQKLYTITHNQNLQAYLVDKQIHYINQEESILVRGGFNAVLKATVIGRSSGGFFYVVPQCNQTQRAAKCNQ